MATQTLSASYIALITKPCLARKLALINNDDGTVTINKKTYSVVDDVENLLETVKRKDLSMNGKKY